MTSTWKPLNSPAADDYIQRLTAGGVLLPDTPINLLEVVGILKSYGVVLGAYAENLCFIADDQFLELFPFFKYFNGKFSWPKLLRHWWHDRINFEYAEYCMRTMMWHGGGGLDAYLNTPAFAQLAEQAIQAKLKHNPLMQGLHRLFPDFLPEQIRQSAYYSTLGQFWHVMNEIFISLSDRYDGGEVTSIPQVVKHILSGLVAAASQPITYTVRIGGKDYEILPAAAGLTFLADAAVPYVEAVFFRGTPFLGVVSYNAQAQQISPDQANFAYGALYADPLPVGSAGIPPTLLMQDMRHFLPEYLHDFYRQGKRGEDDLRVRICQSFQKSMFCVTNAAVVGLAPYPLNTTEPQQQAANQKYLQAWVGRMLTSQLPTVQE
ncbi:MAG: CO2 hydration protein [Aphanocapsa sp. GSE-SYN-MK-11-07L]|jgi:CO2 hydration protein|nr:CO2 hydration protein [Aphanocapsa sp. GSE-SYN-MK-11-07L]